jgi:hypothetical protein
VTETGKVRIKSNVSAATLAQSVKTASIVGTVKDDDGIDIPLSAVVLVDPTQNPALIGNCGMYINAQDGTHPAETGIPGVGSSAGYGLRVLSYNYVWDASINSSFALRTPTVFKTTALITAAGDTVVWAATAGKKHRIMGYNIELAAGTTAAAGSVLTLVDDATTVSTHPICGAALAASPNVVLANVVYPGNGYLQAAVNKDIKINLSTVLAVGGVSINIYGTEE